MAPRWHHGGTSVIHWGSKVFSKFHWTWMINQKPIGVYPGPLRCTPVEAVTQCVTDLRGHLYGTFMSHGRKEESELESESVIFGGAV